MKVVIAGEDYDAYFLLRANKLKLLTATGAPWTDKRNVLFALRVGATYLDAAYQAITSDPQSGVLMAKTPKPADPKKFFEIQAQTKEVPDYERFNEKLPYLDVINEGSALVLPPPADLKPAAPDPEVKLLPEDIFVERLVRGELPPHDRTGDRALTQQLSGAAPDRSCRVHIQIGRSALRGSAPAVVATDVRCIIVTLRDLALDLRIRKSISYESIIVDILRLLRKYAPNPDYSALFDSIAGTTKGQMPAGGPKQLYVIVRINHATALVYRWHSPGSSVPLDRVPDSADVYFHHRHPAPMNDIALGRVDGFTGFLAAHLAEQARCHYENGATVDVGGPVPGWIKEGIKAGILWQVAQNQRGVLRLFFDDTSPERIQAEPSSPLLLPRGKARWEPILQPDWSNGRRHYFDDLRRYLQNEEKWNKAEPEEARNRVELIEIRVGNAVSHRTQWFLAADRLLPDRHTNPNPKAPEFEREFTRIAEQWLTRPPCDPTSDPKKTLPLVTIGSLPLMDRREVEDYLALRDAIRNYEKGEPSKPLNIAVFGAPGAGKSFGVTQVVTHAAGSEGSRLDPQTLSFNVSQFTSLHDLVTALQVVRNECLKGTIPVVFFDEFDSAFEGRPFGWLKYFLAPMQDGEFTDGGRIFRLGACVIVFAGGVNRSFEELNGRLRNPGFVDAKGPDFISRLRAHMNIRGINKPEDDVDQSRYLLRRAIMLHGMLSRKLNPKAGNDREQGLLEASVARAFCGVASFKHGARSMEAILDMCDLQRGRPLGPSDLPAKAQLEMHVDASEFINLVFEFSENASGATATPAP